MKKFWWAWIIVFIAGYLTGWVFNLRSLGFKMVDLGTKDKTFWDYLELFIIPFTLAITAIVVEHFENVKKMKIANDNLEEEIIQDYFEFVARRIEKIHNIDDIDRFRNMLSSKTRSIVKRINCQRKGIILKFIYESGSILIKTTKQKINPIIDLHETDFSEAVFNYGEFNNADFSSIILSKADFNQVTFENVITFEATIIKANFSECNFIGSKFYESTFQNSSFRNCLFVNVDFSTSFMGNVMFIDSKIINTKMPKYPNAKIGMKFNNCSISDTEKKSKNS